MTLYTTNDARTAGRAATLRASAASATQVLTKAMAPPTAHFDVFLSHSMLDADLVLGVKSIVESSGRSVYVDWIDDGELDRGRVTRGTADRLRQRMRNCDSLVYATSPAAASSRWMPWELGYFDGLKGDNIAILPLVASATDRPVGQEYLLLYPTVEHLRSKLGDELVYVTRTEAGSRRALNLGLFVGGRRDFYEI